ncbi:copper(I)-binding protein CorA [Crenothrix polyspora]|uniref:Copper(I)-binding protein CorA domain-containing protein n=1 Tax=Crenothrix polyspora TaxID=360316 RepID=A0A1R4H1S3_9GAMM|nr:copper(I)-binding protein CorA [Crenothrix polyspora]SJM90192.1 exported hypothetical protein [Crenothrix polyspora]
MSVKCKQIVNILTAAVIGFSVQTVMAATKPTKIAEFTPSTPKNILNIKRASWRDPLFGNTGWTHNSDWGKFSTTKNKIVKITLVTKVPGLHPGITVWQRGAKDTAPDSYVPDHFYQQNASIFEMGAKDEANKNIGNIFMTLVAQGYDNDGHTDGYLDDNGKKTRIAPTDVKGIKDSVSGRLVLSHSLNVE